MAVKDTNEFHALRQKQTTIAKQVVLEDLVSEVTSIGVVAQSGDEALIFFSAVVVDALMNVIDESTSIATAAVPYVPGLLFFHEGPAVIATVKKLRRLPDVLLVNGCGINYPRFAGLASHVGVILDMPTVGVSKKNALRAIYSTG